jgi:hypothetical protein
MRIKINLKTVAALALFLATAARADRRSFLHAYEYATQPEGNLEFELWNQILAPRSGGFDSASVEQRIELEYGITDHWDTALYHVFAQGPAEGFHFDGWRLENRYRFAEKGVWPVDLMLYFEVERPADFTAPFETEEKVILERDFGALGLVTNLVAEQSFLHAADHHQWEIDAGVRYEVVPALRVAVEGWTIQGTGARPRGWFLGPSISVATSKLWLQVGAGIGLGIGDTDSTAEVRSVLGFNL